MDIVSCTAPCDDKGRRCLAPAVATGGCPLRLRHRRARPGYHRFGGRGVLRPVITEREHGPSPSNRRLPQLFSATSETTASSARRAVPRQRTALTTRHPGSGAGAAGDTACNAEGVKVSEVAEKGWRPSAGAGQSPSAGELPQADRFMVASPRDRTNDGEPGVPFPRILAVIHGGAIT